MMFDELKFNCIPKYAAYLLHHQLESLVEEQVRLSFELKLPLLEYFKHLDKEELKGLVRQSLHNFLTHVVENTLDEFIETSIRSWQENQLPLLTKHQIVSKDISLTLLIRKRVFLKCLTAYTSDVALIMSVVEEFDVYIAKAEHRTFAFFTDMQQEEINRQLKVIQRSENYHKRAEKLAHIGNWRWEVATNHLEWTEEMHRIYELDIEEQVTYERAAALNHPDDRAMVQEHIGRSLSTGEPFDFYYRIVMTDSREKTVHAVGEVLRENGGNTTLLGTLQDVTTQKATEKLLTDNQKFIAKIARLTPSVISVYNVHTGKYIFINEAIESLLGYTQQQIMDEGNAFFIALIHPDDLATLVEKNDQALQAANAPDQPSDKELVADFYYRMKHKNGEYRWFRTYGTIFDRTPDGKVAHVLNITVDVTDEYNLRLALEEEYAFADMLIENSPDMLVVLDKEMRIVVWNRKAEEHNQLSKDAVLGKHFLDLFPQYNYPAWLNNIERALAGEVVYHPVLKFSMREGYGDVFFVPLRNTDGEVSGILTITRNITDLVLTAGRLQESYKELQLSEDRHYRMINEVRDYAIIWLDKEGNIETWSAGAEAIKGYAANEILGQNFTVFYTPEDLRAQLPHHLLQQAIHEGRAAHEGWQMRKDGTVFWANVVITTLHDEKGGVAGFSKVTKDLTERKIAEDNLRRYADQLEGKNKELQSSNKKLQDAREQLAQSRTRYLIEAMPHIVATTAADGTLDYANQHLMDYLGTSFEDIKQGKWLDAVHASDRKRLLTTWKRCLETKDNLQMEFRFKRSDGGYLWHLAIARPVVKKSEEEPDMWIITLTNIHDQKLMDEKKDEFIGIASHELKTPLTSAKAYAQLLQMQLKKEHNEEAALYAQKTNLFIDRLNNLISELLDITKIQHGKLQMSIAAFDFNAVMATTIELIQHTRCKHRISLQGKAAQPVLGDQERIQQVLINLLSNAIKYSPEADEVTVTITNETHQLQVAVKDAGIGIPRSDQQKIFDRFYRVEDKATKFQGLGIGLFISSEIVKRHRGDIWVDSAPGKGSTFYFTLPFAS